MKNIAPSITRKRLLIEGYYSREIGEHEVEEFLTSIASKLSLKFYGSPIVHVPESLGKEENQGFDAFLPLIDSGISIYVWTKSQFFAIVLFTCKNFSSETAIEFTREYMLASEIVSKDF
ncbi:S-adenosylmethionine decarboxylase [Microbulbifer taiwanensis]|uniref:S-adenosylmethionine decarboxylase n=1 Tax=Microbulbifer taiwanensis TaxID=986746 RepID=A0ABW1YRD1_9GAMM|nr:S-adenosylmethionine decarboxylase [Microbulbifer taiwanensis]